MDNKITGDEPVLPFFKWNEAGYGDAITLNHPDGSRQFINYEPGETLYQRALREFMCALVAHNGTYGQGNGPGAIAERADELTTAYINQINKHQS